MRMHPLARIAVSLALLALLPHCGSNSDSPSSPAQSSSGGPCASAGTEAPGQYPQTDFSPQPAYIPSDTLILTLDDGPDVAKTAQILDILKERNVHVDFFVNTMNYGGPVSLIKRMIDEGHHVGNHTVHHSHLAPGGGMDGVPHLSTAADVESEIAGVETAVQTLTGGAVSQLTRFRAPFGEPYQAGDPDDVALVEPVVAGHAVAIDWNFDTQDSTTSDGDVVVSTFADLVKTPGEPGAAWGIFLMHAVNAQDVDALPKILDYIAAKGFKLATVEDVLCWKFGKHSWEIAPKHGAPAP
jgi:peptidoglycan/xylan/chitin deacetylase (PgdA/CDA1 family)